MVSNGHPCRRYSETWPPLPGAGLDRFPAPFVLRAQKNATNPDLPCPRNRGRVRSGVGTIPRNRLGVRRGNSKSGLRLGAGDEPGIAHATKLGSKSAFGFFLAA